MMTHPRRLKAILFAVATFTVAAVAVAACAPAAPAPTVAPAQPTAAVPTAQPTTAPAPTTAAPAKPTAAPTQAAAAKSEVKQLSIGGTAATSGTYAYFVAVAEVVNQKVQGVNLTVVETGAAAENMRRLVAGKLDMGLAGPPVDTAAYKGTGEYEGKPHPEVRVLWYFGNNSQNVYVRADSGVQKLEDLNGKAFCAGGAGTGTEKNVTAFLTLLGITPNYFRGTIGDCANAVKDRRIVGMGKGGVGTLADSSILDVATATPIRMLGFTDAQIERIKKEFPESPWMSVPAGVYPGQDQAYRTFGAPLPIVGTTNLSEGIVYDVVKAVSEDKERQQSAYKAFKGWDIPQRTVEMSLIPIHKGAVRYYEEVGVKVPADLKKD